MRDTLKPMVERAYELAKSGKFAGMREIRAQLKAEKYPISEIESHLRGPALRKALLAICQARGSAI